MKGEQGCCQDGMNNSSHGTCGCMEKDTKKKVTKFKGKEADVEEESSGCCMSH